MLLLDRGIQRFAGAVTPLFSADPGLSDFSRKSVFVTLLESALTDTPSAKFFRIRTCQKHGGEGHLFAFCHSPSQWKQRGCLRWVAGDGFEFGIAEA